MRIFKANGKTGRTYYVFPCEYPYEIAIKDVAREKHITPLDLDIEIH